MTKLTKTIKRELLASPDFRGRSMFVELMAGDRIYFLLKGKKTRYSVSLHKVYLVALMQTLHEEYTHKLEVYNLKKSAGHKRLRKPKKPTYSFFSRELRKVLNTPLKINMI